MLIAAIVSATALVLALVGRPLVVECFDPGFLRAVGGRGSSHLLFLVVANLVAGFQAMGTLMAVGLKILPAAMARLWATTRPAIILTASLFYFASILFGRGGLACKFNPGPRPVGQHRGA